MFDDKFVYVNIVCFDVVVFNSRPFQGFWSWWVKHERCVASNLSWLSSMIHFFREGESSLYTVFA